MKKSFTEKIEKCFFFFKKITRVCRRQHDFEKLKQIFIANLLNIITKNESRVFAKSLLRSLQLTATVNFLIIIFCFFRSSQHSRNLLKQKIGLKLLKTKMCLIKNCSELRSKLESSSSSRRQFQFEIIHSKFANLQPNRTHSNQSCSIDRSSVIKDNHKSSSSGSRRNLLSYFCKNQMSEQATKTDNTDNRK